MFLPLILFITNLWAIEPMGYAKKPEIKTRAEVIGSQIFFQYGFKKPNGVYEEWSWQDDYARLKALSDQFGVYGKGGDLSAGLFVNHPLVGAIPDYSRILTLYQNTVVELYRHWHRIVDVEKLSRRESIELLLRFLQDYPYGIPPREVGGKIIGGLLVPPLSLEYGWADCDSKSILMATVLSHDPFFKDRMAMILVPGHALLGIEEDPQTYDETYTYQNRTFVVAEPTGLSRTPFGKKNSPYSTVMAIIPLKGPEVAAPVTASVALGTPPQNGLRPLVGSDCPDEGLVVEYFSQLENGKIQVCMIKVGNDFVKHGPLLKYDASGMPKAKENYSRGTKL